MKPTPRHPIGWLILLIAAMSSCSPARAAKVDTRQQAKKFFREAEAQYDAGHYETAVALYRRAYDLAPLPGLLFNIGQAYRKHGDSKQAAEYFRRYLEAEPGGKSAAEAREHLAVLEASSSKPVTPPDKTPEPPAVTTAAPPSNSVVVAPAPVGPVKPSVTQAPFPPSSVAVPAKAAASKARRAPVWPWLVAGGAVVAAGLAIGLGIGFGMPKDDPVDPNAPTVQVRF